MTLLKYDLETGSFRAKVKLPRTGNSQPEVEIAVQVEEVDQIRVGPRLFHACIRVTASAFVDYREELTVHPVL